MKKLLFLAALILANASQILAQPELKPEETRPTGVNQVNVSEVTSDFDLPKVMRNSNNSAQLEATGFDLKLIDKNEADVKFSLSGKGPVFLRIVNQAGYDVYFRTLQPNEGVLNFNEQIVLPEVTPGTYFLQITQKNKTFNRKLTFN